MKSVRIFILLACFLCGIATGYATEKNITKKQLPESVLTSFMSTYPKAKMLNQSIEKEAGTTYYEIESLDGTVRRDLLYTSGGTVHEIEETVNPATLPENIRASLAKDYPMAKISRAEKVTTDGRLVTYECGIKIGKKSKSVEFDASGNALKPVK
ncbi:MAG TPA: PepSY-like domain-containing protein [Bacteroidota bacterium]|nr:PepSY-like domain-containing protein [Bacteroidota bacterium]